MKWKHIAILLLCILFLIPLASATPTNLTLEANPATVIADGDSYSKVRANLTDGGSPVSGAYINFSIGSKTLKVKTNSSGIATILVGPSNSIQTAAVIASTGSLTNSTNVSFIHAAPASLHLYASPSSVGTRNITSTNYTSLIIARVLDRYKNPVPNQQVNFTIYLKKPDGTNSTDFTLSPGTSNTTDTKGGTSLTFSAGNTSGTAYITATASSLYASSNLKILGESYLLVETSVEPENIDPPAIVNVTISMKGGGDKFEGGQPVDAMLVTDVSGSMDPDWYNRWGDFLEFYIDGVWQDGISGNVGWHQKSYNINSGSHTLKWNYVKDGGGSSGSDAGWLDKVEFTGTTVTPSSISPDLKDAADNKNLDWTTGGNANWYRQNSTYYYGGDAAQSGSISGNKNTWTQTTVTGPGTLKFYWKVSSEYNGESEIADGLTEYNFKASGTVLSGKWNITTFYLNESVNDLWFKLNVTELRLQLISPNKTVFGYLGDTNNSPKYMYSKNYPGSSSNPEWVWLKPDTKPGNESYYPTSADSDFPEQGNWTIKVYNPTASTKTFNVSTYIEKLSAAKIASKTFNGLLNPAYDRVGLVPFTWDGPNPPQLYNLTSNISSINGPIGSMFARSGTPTASAIKRATDELIAKERPDVLRYIILLSDGQPTVDLDWDYCSYDTTPCITDAKNEANKTKAIGIRIYTIGIGVDADKNTLQAIASPNSYYYAANASQLKEIYGNIGKQITNISAKQASLNLSLSRDQSYSANATYINGSSKQKYITSDNVTIEYNCLGNACEPKNTTSPLYWNITTPHAPDNRTIKIGDQWILKFQLNLSSDGMLFDLEKSIVDYMNYTGKNLSINVPGAKVSKNATALKPQGLMVKTVILNVSKDKVKANGVSKSDITATVLDEEGNLVPDGTVVIFHTDLGSFSKDSVITKYTTETVNGIATAQIYSKIMGIANIYAESKADWQQDYVQSPTQNLAFTNTRIITIS